MTQPDKWDEIAAKYFYPTRFMAWGLEDRNEFARALRSAFAEGENAGMERAIDDIEYLLTYPLPMGDRERQYVNDMLRATIINLRAAKETKE